MAKIYRTDATVTLSGYINEYEKALLDAAGVSYSVTLNDSDAQNGRSLWLLTSPATIHVHPNRLWAVLIHIKA